MSLLVTCSRPQHPAGPVPTLEQRPLDLGAPSVDLRSHPKLLGRILASPIGYFRFVNIRFANEVCRRFGAGLDSARIVNLHGDAHVEQYAITESGRGLTDFDDAAAGPLVLDLVRFGSSVHLACGERGWHDRADAIVGEFLRGYRAALADPSLVAPEPQLARRVRANLAFDADRYFGWIRSISEPAEPELAAQIRSALDPYVDAMIARDPKVTREYFKIEELGRVRIGVGSALARKYILRIRGPTPSADDDDVLELKQIGDLAGIDCISRSPHLDPMRLIVAQARIAYEPYRLVGYVLVEGRHFWVHAWAKSYSEVSVSDFAAAWELAEIAFDVGVQLGLGHPKYIATPMDRELRRDALAFLDAHEGEIRSTSEALADEVIRSWQRFRDAAAKP